MAVSEAAEATGKRRARRRAGRSEATIDRANTEPGPSFDDLPPWVGREALVLDGVSRASDRSGAAGTETHGPGHDGEPARAWVRWAVIASGALTIAVLLSLFGVKAFFIPSQSMTPTLDVDDRVLVNKVAGLWSDPAHGQLVVFERPGTSTDLIKRVIGTPGDLVEIRQGRVWLNGTVLDEPYLAPGTLTDAPNSESRVQLGPGEYFVLGDNREISIDSRRFGPVRRSAIAGTAFAQYWPLSDLGGL